ncbi:MAG: zinc ribbon domain-containing protein [Ruminococcus sp.]|nr:zinc ribbon domain-containing protein [Ruminococcus sp.]
MERFCDKCGNLIQGEGKFCPSCGAPLESAVDLSKPVDASPVQPIQPTPVSPAGNTYQSPNTAQMPAYPQSYNNAGTPERTENMTAGQWVLTIFLSSLGIIGLILLFVWAFSDTPQPKKNYARGMLIWTAIMVGVSLLLYIGMMACVGSVVGGLGEGFDEIFGSGYYY